MRPAGRSHENHRALSELDPVDLHELFRTRNLPAYRARQLTEGLTRQSIQSLDELTVLPQSLRHTLATEYQVRTTEVRAHLRSGKDGSEKVLFALRDGATVETVLIRSSGPERRERHTVCVSSQVGCPAACSFCATGLAGFTRNLSGPEIVDQVMYFAHQLRAEGKRVSNVVYMGMGEPFLNTGPVRDSIHRLTDPAGFGLGGRHITVSTVGIVPQIRRFAEWAGQVNLAISLHAPTDELRSRLVPYNQHFPIAELMAAVREYLDRTRRRVSFEYVLLRGVNDALATAQELVRLIRPLGGMAHVNVIPWNPFREGQFVRSEGPDADFFVEALRIGGVNATIRYSKGLDISAACGQLRDQVATEANDPV